MKLSKLRCCPGIYAGFTLIEILVVVSVIGLLASIVLVPLNKSRISAQNAAIQQEVVQLRNLIELGLNGSIYTHLSGIPSQSGGNGVANDSLFTVGMVSTTDNIIKRIQTGNIAYGGGTGGNSCAGKRFRLTPSRNGITIFTNTDTCVLASKYAIYAAYGPVVGSSGYYCIDSTGRSLTRQTGAIPSDLRLTAVCQ